jgi:RNA 2',3'-cyclic 3'-phosphodiesterase
MPEQLSLPGLDATAPPFRPDAIRPQGRKLLGYTLFLAIFPSPDDAHRLALAAADLRSQHGLGGTVLPPERLHLSLHALAGFIDTIPQAVVDAAVAASASVACRPLPIVFDQVLSFTDSNAFVWRCNPRSDAAVARLRQSLALALRRAGLHPEPSRAPHMTMLYDPHHVTQHAIEPVCWTATRFALILSHVGIGHHQWIAQWRLADVPGAAASPLGDAVA